MSGTFHLLNGLASWLHESFERLLQRWLLLWWCHKLRSWLRNRRICLGRWTKLTLLMHLLSTYICEGMVLPPREIKMIFPIWIVCLLKRTSKWPSIIIQCICLLSIVFRVTNCRRTHLCCMHRTCTNRACFTLNLIDRIHPST